MRKRALSILTLLSIILLITSCSTSNSEVKNPENENKAKTEVSQKLEPKNEENVAQNEEQEAEKEKQEIEKKKQEAEKKKEEENKKRLNSAGEFIDERTLKLNGADPGNDLSGGNVTLRNIKGNKAMVSFVFSTGGGSVPLNGVGPATYVGNGEWKFEYENESFGEVGIGIVRIKGDKAYFYNSPTGNNDFSSDEYKYVDDKGNVVFRKEGENIVYKKQYTDRDYEKVKDQEATILYRSNSKNN